MKSKMKSETLRGINVRALKDGLENQFVVRTWTRSFLIHPPMYFSIQFVLRIYAYIFKNYRNIFVIARYLSLRQKSM